MSEAKDTTLEQLAELADKVKCGHKACKVLARAVKQAAERKGKSK